MELEQWQNIFHVVVYASSVLQHVIKNKDGIMKHANLNVKIIVSAKKIRVGILAHIFVRIVYI